MTKGWSKALWKLCFTDSDEFTDLYFDLRYKDDINMAVREDGKSFLLYKHFLFDDFCGGDGLSYVSGKCAPHPGITGRMEPMRRLLRLTHRRMYDDGILLSTCINGREMVVLAIMQSRDILRDSGYVIWKGKRRKTYPSGSYRWKGWGSSRTVSVFRQSYAERACRVSHSYEVIFRLSAADLRLEEVRCAATPGGSDGRMALW